MQSYDKYDEVLRSKAIRHFSDVQKELDKPEVKHVRVGNIPRKGETVFINGLKFRAVSGKNYFKKHKRITFELL